MELPSSARADHRVVMASLKGKHAVLLGLLRDRPLHYVDIPMHGNVGDLLVMAGTLRFFEEAKIRVDRMAMYFNYSALECPAGGVIVCHGGGSFGDIYGPFQAFRQRLIRERKDCRVVILPQSLHFEDDAMLTACVEICREHPDLHICVRDPASQAMARRMTDHVYLLPDMAHQLWPMADAKAPASKTALTLKRRDSETTNFSSDPTQVTFDWDDLISPWRRSFLSNIVERGVTQAKLRLGAGALFGNWFARWWIAQANGYIAQAVRLFSTHSNVVSDRLHAHILACLLERPNEIHDNSYGKNSRYINTWTKDSPLVVLKSNNDRTFADVQEVL